MNSKQQLEIEESEVTDRVMFLFVSMVKELAFTPISVAAHE